jgi:ribonuclease P protein component
LSRSGEFDRVYREGTSHATRQLVLYSFPRQDGGEEVRLGVSVGRKVGGAVERNGVKRALREGFWQLEGELPAGSDVVIVARPDLAAVVESEGTDGVAKLLREALQKASSGKRST